MWRTAEPALIQAESYASVRYYVMLRLQFPPARRRSSGKERKDAQFGSNSESSPLNGGRTLCQGNPIPKHDTARLFQSTLAGWDPFGFHCWLRSWMTVDDATP